MWDNMDTDAPLNSFSWDRRFSGRNTKDLFLGVHLASSADDSANFTFLLNQEFPS